MQSSLGIADSAAHLFNTRQMAPQLGPRMTTFMAPPLQGASGICGPSSMMGSAMPYPIMPLPSQPPPPRPPEPPGSRTFFYVYLYMCVHCSS